MTAEQAQRGKTFELLFILTLILKGTSIVMDIKYRYFCEYARVGKAVHLHIASLLLLSVISGKLNHIDGTQRAQGGGSCKTECLTLRVSVNPPFKKKNYHVRIKH